MLCLLCLRHTTQTGRTIGAEEVFPYADAGVFDCGSFQKVHCHLPCNPSICSLTGGDMGCLDMLGVRKCEGLWASAVVPECDDQLKVCV